MPNVTSLKGKGRKTLVALAIAGLTFTVTPSIQAGGATGGATEVTQILNNLELLFANLTLAEDLIIQADHYVTLLQQYDTMRQNLENMDAGTIASTIGVAIDAAGIEGSGSIGETIGKVRRLATAANNMKRSGEELAKIFKKVEGASARMNMSPDEFVQAVGTISDGNRAYFQAQADEANRVAEQLEVDAKAFQDIAAQVPNARGNLQALGQLTQSSILVGKVASETKATLAQMQAMQAHQAVMAQDSADFSAEAVKGWKGNHKRAITTKW